MAGNSSQSQKNSLADHKRRAAGRDPDREKISPVGGAFGRHGVAEENPSTPAPASGGGGLNRPGKNKRAAKKRKA